MRESICSLVGQFSARPREVSINFPPFKVFLLTASGPSPRRCRTHFKRFVSFNLASPSSGSMRRASYFPGGNAPKDVLILPARFLTLLFFDPLFALWLSKVCFPPYPTSTAPHSRRLTTPVPPLEGFTTALFLRSASAGVFLWVPHGPTGGHTLLLLATLAREPRSCTVFPCPKHCTEAMLYGPFQSLLVSEGIILVC